MKNILQMFIVIGCLSNSAIVSADTLSAKKAVEIIKSTVRIKAGGAQGSGVILYTKISNQIRLTYVITNRHVVGNHKNITLEKFILLKDRIDIGRTEYHARVVHVSTEHDLALIEIQTPAEEIFRPVTIANDKQWEAMTLYEPIFLASCGLGSTPYITNGNLAHVNHSETTMFFTASIIFGSSGGGLFDKNGRLVGICNAIRVVNFRGHLHPIPHQALGIPLPAIKSVIEKTEYSFIVGKVKKVTQTFELPHLELPDLGDDEDDEEDDGKHIPLPKVPQRLPKKWY